MKAILLFALQFSLLVSCQTQTSTSIRHIDTGNTLEYRLGQNTLFTYNYTTVYPPADVDTVYKRSGFIHPLNSVSGETLTNLSPPDHYHHYGLWYAWTQTMFMGDTIDFWNVCKKEGTVRFREFTSISDSGFSAILDHVVYPDSDAERAAMTEDFEIKVAGLSPESYFIDYITTLQCATDSAVTLQAYRYGGLVIRARADWTPDRSTFTSSEGFTRDNADDTDARWAFMQGQTEDENDNACILILSHPSNLNHPEPLRIWDENANGGIGDMMWNFSPTKKRQYTLLPSDKLKLHYRIVVFDHDITTENAEALWQRFAGE